MRLNWQPVVTLLAFPVTVHLNVTIGPYVRCMTYNPWGELQKLGHVQVAFTDLPMGVHGRTNGVDRIELSCELFQVERRCALAHELQHLRVGHRGHQPARVELGVRVVVARKLVPLDALVGASCWSGNCLPELADELAVTPAVLGDRLRHLHQGEKQALRERARGLVSV